MNNKKNIQLLLLNILCVSVYFITFFSLKTNVSDDIMFSSPDSREYLAVSTEFYNFSESGYSITRPFLYPLIILLVHQPFGAYGLWVIQFICWIVSINLLYLSIKQATNNQTLGFIGSLILALNFSYIVLTMHGLTEVVSIFLLSLLIYLVGLNIIKAQSIKKYYSCLFIFVLLAVIKPLFFLPLIFILFVILPFLYFKKRISLPQSLFMLAFIITPLLFQMGLMKIKYDTFSVSEISSITFKKYILAQGVQKVDHLSREEAQQKAQDFSTHEVINYIFKNKMEYVSLFFQNLKENIKTGSTFLSYPKGFESPVLAAYMVKVNALYYYLHIIFLVPVLLILYKAFAKKDMNTFILIVFSFALTCYILLTSAISSWQGDRLVLSALPVWIFLYSLIINYMDKNYFRFR